MDYGVLLRCTSVYFSVLQWTIVYFGVQQCTSAKFSIIQLNSGPHLVTFHRLWCPVRSQHWQTLAVSLLILLSLLVGLVFILFRYFFLGGSFICVVHFLLVLLSYGNLRHPEWLCRLCFLLSCLSFASEDCTLFCCLFLFVCLSQPVTGSAVTSCCRVIDLWSTFHQLFCLHFIFSGDVIYNFSLQS